MVPTPSTAPALSSATKVTLRVSSSKRLAGVKATSELERFLEQTVASAAAMTRDYFNENRTKDRNTTATATTMLMTLPEARTLLIEYFQNMRQEVVSLKENASTNSINNNNNKASTVLSAGKRTALSSSSSHDDFIPISVIRAAGIVLSEDANKLIALDQCIRKTSLAFRISTPVTDSEQDEEERQRFQKRLERLRLKQEERNYSKLTRNVLDQNALSQQHEEITTKSMTYAASIGLNMIVAPLSFGCVMYYFGGNLLDWVFPRSNSHHHGSPVDIRRVIVSVLSGVIMLIVEMLLFVIRTHEVDKAMRSKQRKKERNPTGSSQAFGYYNAHTRRHYKDH